jgi:hypothetical protein
MYTKGWEFSNMRHEFLQQLARLFDEMTLQDTNVNATLDGKDEPSLTILLVH